MALTAKQCLFVEEFKKDGNATQAALRAGYSPKTAYSIGSENLKKPEIAAAIQAWRETLKMQADEVLERLTDHARGTMRDFITIAESGEPWISFTEAQAKDKLHLVKRFKVKKKSGDNWTETEVEVELYDAQRALELLGKHHGLFPNKVDVNWQDDFRKAGIDPDEMLDKLTDELEERLTSSAPETPAGSP